MPETIGRYRIVARLSPGRLGAVYKAFDPAHQRHVALRVIRQPGPDDVRQRAGFELLRNAVRAAARLTHANVAAIHDHGETVVEVDAGAADPQTGVLFIASALVDGVSLAARLTDGMALDPGRAHRCMTQILLALDHAHDRDVVHADLKPANVLITASDEVRLTDFGLNCGYAAAGTKGDSILGTPEYLAPEQLLGDPVDARSDVFAAGALLYQMLTGRRPFQGDAAAVMEQILARDPTPPSRLQPGLGPTFDGVVARALARLPGQRFATAAEFLLALNRATFQRAASVVTREAAGLVAEPPVIAEPIVAPTAATRDAWKAAAAEPLEAALADAVGPIARILVRNALAHAASFDAACAGLAAQVSVPALREVFVATAGRIRSASAVPEALREAQLHAAPQSLVDSPAHASGRLIDQATLDQAIDRLSDDVGPMARILADSAASRAKSRTAFFHLLAEWIPTPQQRDKFLREFGIGE